MANCLWHYLYVCQGYYLTIAPGQTPPGMLFLFYKIKRIVMNDIEYLKNTYSSVKLPKLSVEREQLYKMRERQRRQRKEKLYSFTPEYVLNM